MYIVHCYKKEQSTFGHSEVVQGTRASFKLKAINNQILPLERFEQDASLTLSQFNDFRMNRDKVIALGTWLKIHTNISHFRDSVP